MLRTLTIRSLHTLKSRNDELINQPLLNRLKQIKPIGKRIAIEETKVRTTIKSSEIGVITLKGLKKLIKLHINDPIVWNPSILSKIFKVSEDHCKHVVHYVQPMVFYIDSHLEKPTKLVRTSQVIEVDRLKTDKTYLEEYQSLAFFDMEKDSETFVSTIEVNKKK